MWPLILGEKLGQNAFDLISMWKLDNSSPEPEAHMAEGRVAILFHYAILKDETVGLIKYWTAKHHSHSEYIDKAQKQGTKAVVLCYYSTPSVLGKIRAGTPVYALMSHEQLKGMKKLVLNELGQFKSPVAEDYEVCVKEQLDIVVNSSA